MFSKRLLRNANTSDNRGFILLPLLGLIFLLSIYSAKLWDVILTEIRITRVLADSLNESNPGLPEIDPNADFSIESGWLVKNKRRSLSPDWNYLLKEAEQIGLNKELNNYRPKSSLVFSPLEVNLGDLFPPPGGKLELIALGDIQIGSIKEGFKSLILYSRFGKISFGDEEPPALCEEVWIALFQPSFEKPKGCFNQLGETLWPAGLVVGKE